MLLICKGCTTAYSVGAPACPQCGSMDHAEQGAEGDPTLAAAPAAAPAAEQEAASGRPRAPRRASLAPAATSATDQEAPVEP